MKSEGLSEARFKRLKAVFNDSLTELYLLFHQAVLLVFITLNKMLQSEEPLIYFLYKCQQWSMNKLASRCVKLDITRNLKVADKFSVSWVPALKSKRKTRINLLDSLPETSSRIS